MSFQVNVKKEITNQMVANLLITAREGGSNYWIEGYTCDAPEQEFTPIDGELYRFADYPLNGGVIHIQHNDGDIVDLTKESLQTGLQIMADKYPHHFKDLVEDNMDADTADAYLQCCLFDGLLYG